MIPLLLALFFVPQDKPPEKATLSGVVVDSVTRRPLSRVTVLAEPAQGPPASTETDAEGHFELVGLEPGQYHVKGRRNSYQDTYYGARRATSRGTSLSLDPGQQWKDLEIKLLPYAVVAGTIRDTDGEPIAGATVSLYSVGYVEGVPAYDTAASRETDDLGQYRAIVAPGRYYVYAEPKDERDLHESVDHSAGGAKPRERIVPMYFPGVTDTTASRPIEVEPGARLTAIDITLPRRLVYRVKVHVDAPAGLPVGIKLQPPHEGGQEIDFKSDSKGKGDFEFRNVPPGSYVVAAWVTLPSEPTSDFMRLLADSKEYRARLPIEVGNADQEVRIAIVPGAQITARIAVEGEDAPLADSAHLTFRSASFRGESWMGKDHTFQAVLSPGRYEVYVRAGKQLITKSIRAGTADVLANGLTIEGPAKIALDIVLTTEAGRVKGVVLDKDEKPVAGATVVLVPAPDRRHRWDLFRSVTADQYGRFEILGITPGDHKLLAWDDVEPDAWFDPEMLKQAEPYGTPVTAQAKATETVTVHVIPAR